MTRCCCLRYLICHAAIYDASERVSRCDVEITQICLRLPPRRLLLTCHTGAFAVMLYARDDARYAAMLFDERVAIRCYYAYAADDAVFAYAFFRCCR